MEKEKERLVRELAAEKQKDYHAVLERNKLLEAKVKALESRNQELEDNVKQLQRNLKKKDDQYNRLIEIKSRFHDIDISDEDETGPWGGAHKRNRAARYDSYIVRNEFREDGDEHEGMRFPINGPLSKKSSQRTDNLSLRGEEEGIKYPSDTQTKHREAEQGAYTSRSEQIRQSSQRAKTIPPKIKETPQQFENPRVVGNIHEDHQDEEDLKGESGGTDQVEIGM